jgi:hypothetical protein
MHFLVLYDCSPITIYFDGKSLRYGETKICETDDGFTLNEQELYTKDGAPLCRTNLRSCTVDQPISLVRFTSTTERGYRTSDPVGTYRFDDAQKVIRLEDKLIVKVAIIDYKSNKNSCGFAQNAICRSIVSVYTYPLSGGKVVDRTLHYEIGNCVAERNYFNVSETKKNPLTEELVKAIEVIQPKSKFAETRFAVQFWSNCVLRNAQEVFGKSNLQRFSGALRSKSAAESNVVISKVLKASGNRAVHVFN